MARRRENRTIMDRQRWDLIEEAAYHYQMAPFHRRMCDHYPVPGGYLSGHTENLAQFKARIERLDAIVEQVLTPKEQALARGIARGEVRAPYPPSRENHCRLHELAAGQSPDGDIVDLAAIRAKREALPAKSE